MHVAQWVAYYRYYGKPHFSHLPIPNPTMSLPMSRPFLDVAIASTTAPILCTIAQANSRGFRPHRWFIKPPSKAPIIAVPIATLTMSTCQNVNKWNSSFIRIIVPETTEKLYPISKPPMAAKKVKIYTHTEILGFASPELSMNGFFSILLSSVRLLWSCFICMTH